MYAEIVSGAGTLRLMIGRMKPRQDYVCEYFCWEQRVTTVSDGWIDVVAERMRR